jgi:hypothetical protein
MLLQKVLNCDAPWNNWIGELQTAAYGHSLPSSPDCTGCAGSGRRSSNRIWPTPVTMPQYVDQGRGDIQKIVTRCSSPSAEASGAGMTASQHWTTTRRANQIMGSIAAATKHIRYSDS